MSKRITMGAVRLGVWDVGIFALMAVYHTRRWQTYIGIAKQKNSFQDLPVKFTIAYVTMWRNSLLLYVFRLHQQLRPRCLSSFIFKVPSCHVRSSIPPTPMLSSWNSQLFSSLLFLGNGNHRSSKAVIILPVIPSTIEFPRSLASAAAGIPQVHVKDLLV